MLRAVPSLFAIIFLLLFQSVSSQILEVNKDGDPNSVFTPQELIENVLVSGSCANVSNFSSQTNGSSNQNRDKSYGYFKRPTGSSFPFTEGVILTSGKAYSAGNSVISSDLDDGGTNWGGDDDLKNALNLPSDLYNATFIEFDFVPTSTDISFRYIMASEEYTGTFPCNYSDSFAFLLKKVGDTNFQNLAVIPGTSTPVSVVNIHPEITADGGCAKKNEQYFAGYNMGDSNYNGRTTVLTASATVIPNQTYRIKLVVADAVDEGYDTAVFLEAGSFVLGLELGDDLLKVNNTAACGSSKLLEANLDATSYTWYKDDVVIPGENSKTYLANLGDGIYKVEIPLSATCTASDSIKVEFVTSPTINPNIAPIEECDHDNDGSVFYNLKLKDTEILNGQDPNLFEVQYFSDSMYQNLITNPSNPNIYVLNSNSETIYTRVVNKESINCVADSQFQFIKYEVPVVTKPIDYELCDDLATGSDTDGYSSGFDLQSKNSEIVSPAAIGSVNFLYYRNQTDANTKSNPIVNSTNFTNEVKDRQTIVVRIEDVNNPNCFKTTSFDLVVNPLPIVNSTSLKQCDNDTDGYSAFNLTEANAKISSNAANETFTYYISSSDAAAEISAIPNPTSYINNSPSTDKVWAVVKSDKLCSRIAEISLSVSTTGIPTSFNRTFYSCDDFLDINGNGSANNDDTDGVTSFDFSSVTADILALFPAAGQKLIVTYYRNEADALAEENMILDPSNYRNIGYPFTQDIYARVDSELDNDCLGLGHHVTLNVDPVPVLQDLQDLEICDDISDGDDRNGIVDYFDLDSQTTKVLGSLSPSNYSVSYHLTQGDADSGLNPQSSPFTNIIRDRQTIYTRVVNNTTTCVNTHKTFDVVVNPLPLVTTVSPLEICDDESDGSAFTGFSQKINLDDKLSEILGPSQAASDYTVTYHLSPSDAGSGSNPQSSPFSNTLSPFKQTIYVRIQENITSTKCVSFNQFDVLVHPEPESVVIPPLELCDDDNDGNDTNGFVQTFDLDAKIDQILGTKQSRTNFTVTFHEKEIEATSGANPIASPYTNIVRDRQTIYVRVYNKTTKCFNDSEKFDIVVNPLPEFKVDSPQIVCLNNTPKELNVRVTAESYTYSWFDDAGFLIGNGNKAYINKGGDYTVIATKKDGTGCQRTLVVKVNESNLSSLTVQDIEVKDDSSNNSIKIDLTNVGIGDYEFALEDASFSIIKPYQDKAEFDNLLGGIYTVLVRDKNGCGVIRIEVSVISFPKYFTPNNDGYHDTWSIRGVNLDHYSRSTVYIFDRYGKLLKQFDPTNQTWDGTYLGKQLPSDDYWFTVKLLKPNGEIRFRKGHFTLKR